MSGPASSAGAAAGASSSSLTAGEAGGGGALSVGAPSSGWAVVSAMVPWTCVGAVYVSCGKA